MDSSTLVPLGSFSIAPDHPCLDGHFPGDPLVPGVVLLDEALIRLRAYLQSGPPVRLQSIKFLAPVLPGDTVQVALRGPAGAAVSFACLVRGSPVVTGTAGFGKTPE
jgi:3-hydroxymyristoyl/3-hydroxydecanoyl-(acyl carrier protein) dehydratase